MVEILVRREIMQKSVYVFAFDKKNSWRIKRRKSGENVKNSDELRIKANEFTAYSIMGNKGMYDEWSGMAN